MSKILEEKLKWYDDNYRQGNALISDAQFDQLEKNLERINPKSDYFIAKNNLILPSLPKDQLKEFLDGLLNKTRLIIELGKEARLKTLKIDIKNMKRCSEKG